MVAWRDPLADANAVRGLEFSAALSEDLAVATLTARIGDRAPAREVVAEERVTQVSGPPAAPGRCRHIPPDKPR